MITRVPRYEILSRSIIKANKLQHEVSIKCPAKGQHRPNSCLLILLKKGGNSHDTFGSSLAGVKTRFGHSYSQCPFIVWLIYGFQVYVFALATSVHPLKACHIRYPSSRNGSALIPRMCYSAKRFLKQITQKNFFCASTIRCSSVLDSLSRPLMRTRLSVLDKNPP